MEKHQRLPKEIEDLLDAIFMPAKKRLEEIEGQCPECEFKKLCEDSQNKTTNGDKMYEALPNQTQTAVIALSSNPTFMKAMRDFCNRIHASHDAYEGIQRVIKEEIKVEDAINVILMNMVELNDIPLEITVKKRK